MHTKLIIKKDSDEEWYFERDFELETITLGRDQSNTVLLEDPQKVVSRLHSKIIYQYGHHSLVDCGSQNSTYVNGKRIKRSIPQMLSNGDRIKIGPYNIEYYGLSEKLPQEATVIIANAFKDDMMIFSALIKRIRTKYDQAVPHLRDDMFKEALKKELAKPQEDHILEMLRDSLNENKTVAHQQNGYQPDDGASEPLRNGISKPNQTGLFQLVVLVFGPLRTIAKQTHSFRNRFFAVSFPEGGFSFHTSTAEDLRDYLLSPDLSEEEISNRVNNVTDQINDILNVYKAILHIRSLNVNDVFLEMLKPINPHYLRDAYAAETFKLGPLKIPYRFIPFYVRRQVKKTLKENLNDLFVNEANFLDKEIIQPLFKDVYLEAKSPVQTVEQVKE